ncbi:MAG: IS30 family transposase, partial [Lachnospiraceae bacterium]|nr:IS30 family transposase [Lachnospiraceae bacterium]
MIINKKYSPYAIVQYMKNNDITFGCDLCEKSIYNYVYRGFIRVKKEQMLSPRHNRKQLNRRKVNYNAMKFPSIEQRPNCANERDEFGHWEIDTVYSGKGTSKACLLTLTERMTRIEESYLLPDRTAKSIVNVFNFIEKEVGFEAFTKRYKTLTSDNGVEFKDFINICLSPYTGKPRTEQYFTHPYSSYERGTNENHNRMIRRFIPKGMDLFKLTQKQIDDIVDYINNYPRRMFGGLSSKQYYEKHVLGGLVT